MTHDGTTPGLRLPGRTGVIATDPGGQLVLRRVRVRVLSGETAGEERLLEDGTLIVGSHPDADLRVVDSTVSRHHAELALLGEGVRVRDLGSTNGTFAGNARIESAIVAPPIELRFGRARVELSAADLPAPELPSDRTRFGPLVGRSAAMRHVFALLERVADTATPLLLEGEEGTGKSLAAGAVHDASSRAKKPYVVVDLGATRSEADIALAFKEAQGGTIVLERLDEAPTWAQEALAGPLSERERGASDVRPIATSRGDLRARVAQGALRRDLFFQLAVVRVVLPPLRERIEDVPLLVAAIAASLGEPSLSIDQSELAPLAKLAYRGNVRELARTIEGALVRRRPSVPPPPPSAAAPDAARLDAAAGVDYHSAKERVLAAFEKAYVQELLAAHDGNLSKAAAAAGLDRNHLARLAKKHGVR